MIARLLVLALFLLPLTACDEHDPDPDEPATATGTGAEVEPESEYEFEPLDGRYTVDTARIPGSEIPEDR